MASRAKIECEVGGAKLRRRFEAGDIDPRDIYAEKWPDLFEKADDGIDTPEGGDDE